MKIECFERFKVFFYYHPKYWNEAKIDDVFPSFVSFLKYKFKYKLKSGDVLSPQPRSICYYNLLECLRESHYD
jgi:hypothetical protein